MKTTERTAKSVQTHAAKLEASRVRMAKKIDRADSAVETLKAKLAELKAKLEKAETKATTARQEADAVIAKRTADLESAKARHQQAVEREQAKAAKPKPAPAGTVETEDGVIRHLDKAAVETVRKTIGRHKSGKLSPLDGAEAQAVLDAIEAKAGNVGDWFEVHFRGRRTSLLFTIEEGGLRFVTVNNAAPAAA